MIIIIIKNIQNRQYTIQFFSLPDDRLRSLFLSSDCGFRGAHGFHRTHGFHRAPAC